MKIGDSPATVKFRNVPNISATDIASAGREGFGTGISQETCRIDSTSNALVGLGFRYRRFNIVIFILGIRDYGYVAAADCLAADCVATIVCTETFGLTFVAGLLQEYD